MTSPASDPSSQHLKVLLVTHELTLTGAPRLALEIFRALDGAVDLRTISRLGGGLEAPFRQLGPVRLLNRLPGRLDRWPHPAQRVFAEGFGRLVAPFAGVRARLWQPDVVFVNSAAAVTLVPRLRLRGLPVLLYVHELGTAIERMSADHRDLLSTLPHRWIAVSDAVAELLVASHRVPRDLLSVIPPLIDLDRITTMAGESSLASADAGAPPPFLIGGAGNPIWTKGIESWLQMARALVDQLGDEAVNFEWVGIRANDTAVEFRAMIRKLGLQSNVRLTAETANPFPRYRRFDVFAMTSWEESASLVVLENMALGVPVVCFRGSGGPPEVVADAGLILERFSPPAMADAIARLLADPVRRSVIAAGGRTRVETMYSPERIVGLVAHELTTVAARGAGR